MVGKVAKDETRLASITAWVPGRIERMYADFTGVQVRRGDHMVDLYSPELLAAKEELRRARQSLDRLPDSAPDSLRNTATTALEAVRARLIRWGLTPSQVERAEAGGSVSDRITIYAPIGGTVIERNGLEGQFVETGTRIYQIADFSTVWVKLDAYEADLPWLHYGQTVSFAAEAFPGEIFEGKVAFIDPVMNDRTRTVPVRVNVPNPDGKLRPGMFVRAIVSAKVATGGRVMDPDLAGKWISPMHPEIVKDGPGSCDICGMALVPAEDLGFVPAEVRDEDMPLLVPASAALRTGRRAIVYVAVPGADRPTFDGRVVELGPRAGDYFIVRRGLREGDRVVTQGNFKIDSALQMMAQPSMMAEIGGVALSLFEEDLTEVREALRNLLQPYVEMSDYLAYDDFPAAVGILDELAAALAAIPADAAFATPLQGTLPALQQSESIEEFRVAFEPLTDRFIEAILMVGMAPGEPVYRVHCPMAFDFQGADWVQTDQEVRNPYFGSEMFSCGTVEEALVEAEDGEIDEVPPPREQLEEAHDHAEVHEDMPGALRELLAPYTVLSDHLADDDPDSAADALDAVEAALEALPGGESLTESLHAAMTELREASGDLAAMRVAFEPLSDAFIAAVGEAGMTPGEPVYRVHCPMAFDFEGADWIQTDRAVRNPYFGSEMYECGSVRDELVAEEGGHDH